jgi:hypothetical protein
MSAPSLTSAFARFTYQLFIWVNQNFNMFGSEHRKRDMRE